MLHRLTRARMALLAGMAAMAAVNLYSQPSVLTWHNDNARTGQNLQESILTLANVKTPTFGRLFTLTVSGEVDAQPLYVPGLTIASQAHNVLYIVTEHDNVYAFDADTGAVLKEVSLIPANQTTSDDRSCGQVTPEIGITSTPAIDLNVGAHGTMFVVAMTKDANGNYHHYIHALDLTTLADEVTAVEVTATYPGSSGSEKKNSGDTVQTFLPAQHKERSALLISNGVVYTSWSSHCDYGPYTSWVIGYKESTLAQTSVLNLAPNGSDGGIWNAGSGPQADAAGNVYIAIGNGTFDTTLLGNGMPSHNDYGNAYVRISTTSGMAVADYFTMSGTVSESGSDTDLGSGGGMLLPPLNDSNGNSRQLAVVAGKDANIYVMDRTNLGKFNPSTDEVFQQVSGVLASGVWSSPAWFNGTLYYGAQGDTVKALTFASGKFGTTPASQTSHAFGYPGATPAISANGTSNAIVWVAENTTPAVLHALNAANLASELYNSSQAANGADQFGAGNKFIVPTIVNGKVYVAAAGSCTSSTCIGEVGVFGLVNTSATPDFSVGLSPSSRTVASGASTTYTVTTTATGGFTGTIDFAVSGLPSGASGGFNPTSVSGSGSTTLTITTTSGASAGTTTFSVTGTSGALNNAGSTSLTITGPPPDFSLGISPPIGSAMAGGSAQYTVTAAGVNGFNATISLGVTGLPPGASASFNPTSLSGPGSTILTITPAANSMIGTFAVSVTGTSGSLSHSAAASLVVNPVPGAGLEFVPITPCRIADTRNADGPYGGPALPAAAAREFSIVGSACGIPANAQAYALNLTVVPSAPLGFLSVWPAGQPQPTVSTLNSSDGRIKANAAIVPAGTNGSIELFASNSTDAIIDINGYFVPAGAGNLAFYPLAPCRIADTRTGTGTFAGPALVGAESRTFPLLSSACNIPASAQAYSLNLTVVPSGPLGFLSAWPAGSAQPGVSTLNAPTGTIVANAAIVPAGTGGGITVIATDPTNLIIDINGYFAPAGGIGALLFRPLVPCRILDTRNAAGPFGGPELAAAAGRSFVIPDSGCQVPNAAQAYSLNATVVPPAPLGFLTLWGNNPQPAVSTLNDSDGTIVANAAIVPAASDGSVNVFPSNITQLILDINGFFAP
jgi:hypothetical protein